jgi:cytoskeletal protein RodZ
MAANQTSQHREKVYITFDVISKSLVYVITLLAGLLSWNISQFQAEQTRQIEKNVEQDLRLKAIESNRFTSTDALRERQSISGEIVELRKWVEENFPPEYLLEDLREIKANQKETRDKMDTLILRLNGK